MDDRRHRKQNTIGGGLHYYDGRQEATQAEHNSCITTMDDMRQRKQNTIGGGLHYYEGCKEQEAIHA